jgi:hypothetical protein
MSGNRKGFKAPLPCVDFVVASRRYAALVTPHRTSQIPFQCPNCYARKGFPIGLAVENRTTVVAVVRCKACAHLWQLRRQSGQDWPARVASSSN